MNIPQWLTDYFDKLEREQAIPVTHSQRQWTPAEVAIARRCGVLDPPDTTTYDFTAPAPHTRNYTFAVAAGKRQTSPPLAVADAVPCSHCHKPAAPFGKDGTSADHVPTSPAAAACEHQGAGCFTPTKGAP